MPTHQEMPLLQYQGYKLYRNEEKGDYLAVLVHCRLSAKLFENKTPLVNFNNMEKSIIIKRSLRALLNSIIFDPIQQTVRMDQLVGYGYESNLIKKICIGRPF